MFIFIICVFIPHLVHSIFESRNASIKLYTITAFNNRERSTLYSMHMTNNKLRFLNSITKEAVIPMHVVVDNCCMYSFEKSLRDFDIEYQYNEYSITKQQFDNKLTRNTELTNQFLSWKQVPEWVALKERRFPILLRKILLGYTYEKRELFLLRLSTGKKLPAVFVMGGEVGSDWLSPGILLSFIDDILHNTTGLRNLLDFYSIYVLPVFNPDGYEYSLKYDRFWRKNRQVIPKKSCWHTSPIGVNIDRNWYITEGSSPFENSPCAPVYIGQKTLSEAEPQAVSRFLNTLAPNLMAFINLKGFDRLILAPYADYTDHTSNFAILMEILTSTCEKLQKDLNTTFYYGSTENLIYNASGNSADWVKKNLNVPIVYTVHMRYKDHLIPQAEHIGPLRDQFAVILQKTLMLAHSIYHPLFNGEVVSTINNAVVAIILTTIAWTIISTSNKSI